MNNSLSTATLAEVRNIVHAALMTPVKTSEGRMAWGLPLGFVGTAGVGKSSVLAQAATSCGLSLSTLSMPIYPQEEIGGYGVPDFDNDRIRKLVVGRIADACKEPYTVLLVDELTGAMRGTLDAMLRVILEREAGENRLPSTVRFLIATNPVEMTSAGSSIPPALANRSGWMQWPEPTVQAWADYECGSFDDFTDLERGGFAKVDKQAALDLIKSEEARVIALWPAALAEARGMVAGFLQSRPALLNKPPRIGDAAAEGAYETPRSWSMTLRALASAKVNGLTPAETDAFIAAFVGGGAASEFATWRAVADLPKPADVLDGVVKWSHNPGRLDKTVAVLTGCATLLNNQGLDKRAERAGALWRLLLTVADTAADLTTGPANALVAAKLFSFAQFPEAKTLLARIAPLTGK